MKWLIPVILLLALASGCGKRSAVGTIVGGAAGTGIGLSMDEGNNTTMAAAGIGALVGLIVGGIWDLSTTDAWSCPDNEPRCLD